MYYWHPMTDRGYKGTLAQYACPSRTKKAKYPRFIKDGNISIPYPVAQSVYDMCLPVYVGMAEFATNGIFPQALNYIACNPDYCPREITLVGNFKRDLFVIARPDQEDIIQDIVSCIRSDKTEKQIVGNVARIHQSFCGTRLRYDGWVDIKDPLLFFVSECLYRNFCRLYGFKEG